MERPEALAPARTAMPPPPVPWLGHLERMPDPVAEPPGLTRLHRNERAQRLPDWFVSRVRDAIDGDVLTHYPATDDLYDELSVSVEIARECLLLSVGSDAAIKSLYQAYVRPGDAILALEPSYAMYRVYAEMFQARLVGIPIGRDLVVDTERLLDAIGPDVRLVMIANPNQPTGTVIEEDVLLEVLERAAHVGALVAIDEAYFPFSKVTMLQRIHDFAHLVVLRTFSKASGLAGLRIGFVAGHPEVVTSLWKVRAANEINSMAVLCAREILHHPELVTDYVEQVDDGKLVLAERVRDLGLEPLPTQSNFMLIRVGGRCEPNALADGLRQRGFVVKGAHPSECVADCIRVTLGPPELMLQLATALEHALGAVDQA